MTASTDQRDVPAASDATATFPSSWYTGRLAGDPLGTMPQGEGSFVDGTGSQTGGGNRWGDYTAMTVDPVRKLGFICNFTDSTIQVIELDPARAGTDDYQRIIYSVGNPSGPDR